MPGFIRYEDHQWQVESATFSASIRSIAEADRAWGRGTGGILWYLNIEAQEGRYLEELVHPRVYVDDVLADVKSWRDFEEKEFFWPNEPDIADTYERNRPVMYVLTHDDVYDVTAAFGRRSGVEFELRLTGDDPPFVVETLIKFDGVQVNAADKGGAWELLCQQLRGEDFLADPVEPNEAFPYFSFRPRI